MGMMAAADCETPAMPVTKRYIVVRRAGGAAIVKFTRPDLIDPVYIRAAGDEIFALIKNVAQPRVVIDFDGIRYLSSATLSVLRALHEVIRKSGGRLAISAVHELSLIHI